MTPNHNIEYLLADLVRRVNNMIVISTVTQRSGNRVKVAWADGVESDWLYLAQLGSKDQKFWIPQNKGDQVLVLSPAGDTTRGVVYPAPFSGEAPQGNFEGVFQGEGDFIASGISLTTHKHGGVKLGLDETKEPI